VGDRGGAASGARRVPVYAGALHYWRAPVAQWRAALARLHGVGLTLVETPVPWRVHEPRPGAWAWGGRGDEAALDLPRFLEAAHAAGLGVVLRLGPLVGADLACWGLPDHVVADPAAQARTARGTPAWVPLPPRAFPAPSFASAAFLGAVQAWYAQLAAVIAPYLAPAGPVVALGLEADARLGARLGAFDLDYHPDAIAAWRADTGEAGEPPRAWDPAAPGRCVAWVRAGERALARALARLGAALDGAGLDGIARFVGLPPGYHGHADARALAGAVGGAVAISAGGARSGLRALRARAAAVVGAGGAAPLALVSPSAPPWLPPPESLAAEAGSDPILERDRLLTLLACGVRGFDLGGAVARDRYVGGLVSGSGAIAPGASWLPALLAALHAVEWPALRCPAPIGVVDTRADARFGQASSVLDPLTPVLAELLALGPAGAAELGTDAGAVAARRWQDGIASALDLAQLPYELVSEGAPAAALARYRAVVAPTGARVDRGLWGQLRAAAEARSTVVVIGPEVPVRDELDAPLLEPAPRRVGRLQAGSLDDLAGLAADLAGLAASPDVDADAAWHVERPAGTLARVHVDAAGAPRAVFVFSDAPAAVTAVLRGGPAAGALRDPIADERFPIVEGRAAIPLPPRGVRMLVVE
jgi:beta-galactosidase